MGLFETVKKISENNPERQVLLILHTSCVLETAFSLRKLKTLPNVSISLTNNVFYELLLLRYSQNKRFSANASLIITELCDNKALKYDTEQFYKGCTEFTDTADIHNGITVFGFYDHLAAEEFLKYSFSAKSDDVYVVSFDPFRYNRDFDYCLPVSSFFGFKNKTEQFLCKCVPENSISQVNEDPVKDKKLRITDGERSLNDRFIWGNSLKLIAGGIGGEAKVYSSPELPGKVIKCYTKFYPSKEKTQKLKDLIFFGKKINSKNVVMPTELVYDREKRCIGFVMPEVKARSISSIYYNELWYLYDRKAILRALSLILLELRLYHINVVDLSGNNVRIGEDGKVYIIDCDSFETYRYPGSGFTPPYGSPDIKQEELDTRLREPHQNNFEFAVLMFQCLLGWENPLTQKNMGDESPEWGIMQFPYEPDSQNNAAKSKFERWLKLDEEIRRIFADEFHFRRWHSIGAWIKALDLWE